MTIRKTIRSTIRRPYYDLVKPWSGLNLNITDAMMEEDVDYYFASEDEADVYLQLVEE